MGINRQKSQLHRTGAEKNGESAEMMCSDTAVVSDRGDSE